MSSHANGIEKKQTSGTPTVPPRRSTRSQAKSFKSPLTTSSPIDQDATTAALILRQVKACTGLSVGLYSWDQRNWIDFANSPLITYLNSEDAHRLTCGDVYVNVADYSSADYFPSESSLVPFIKRVRESGNSAVVWLTYGDVTEKNVTAVYSFIETFKRWLATVSAEDAAEIQPIGISFDIENFPAAIFKEVLQRAQALKTDAAQFSNDGLLVGCTIEGQYKPVDTDIIMRFADRALMMAYRNYITRPDDPTGESNGIIKHLRFMFTEQCEKCLDDAYASAHYRAKITIMFETACKLGASCSYISFCAFDQDGHEGGIDYFKKTVKNVDALLTSSGLMTDSQKARLISAETPFVAHHWEWFDCFIRSDRPKNGLCRDYHSLASTCRLS